MILLVDESGLQEGNLILGKEKISLMLLLTYSEMLAFDTHMPFTTFPSQTYKTTPLRIGLSAARMSQRM
jgi:hypothetical protein